MASEIKPIFLKPKIIEKGWGKEIWIVNNNKYCGKLLYFNKNSKFSMHYHILKNETWFINEGEFIFRYYNGENADIIQKKLKKNDCINIPSCLPHQLECINGGCIIEISTQHFDTDSFRIIKGDSQK